MQELLIIDDEPTSIFFLKEGLEKAGFKVSAAESKTEAVSILMENRFDLTLVDYSLDDGTGLDVIRECVTEDIFIPFAMITGLVDENIIIESARLGALDFIIKPIDMVKLIPQVQTQIIRGKHTYKLSHDNKNTQIINQAVGYLTAQENILPDEAVSRLQAFARNKRIKLYHAAQEIMDAHQHTATIKKNEHNIATATGIIASALRLTTSDAATKMKNAENKFSMTPSDLAEKIVSEHDHCVNGGYLNATRFFK